MCHRMGCHIIRQAVTVNLSQFTTSTKHSDGICHALPFFVFHNLSVCFDLQAVGGVSSLLDMNIYALACVWIILLLFCFVTFFCEAKLEVENRNSEYLQLVTEKYIKIKRKDQEMFITLGLRFFHFIMASDLVLYHQNSGKLSRISGEVFYFGKQTAYFERQI